jgi:FKBP-type peptidyl-prolyl cis-trans isomerase FklB
MEKSAFIREICGQTCQPHNPGKNLNVFAGGVSINRQPARRRPLSGVYRIAFCRAIGDSSQPFRKIDMKKLFVTMFCLGVAAPLFADGTNQLADENSRVSYAIGMMTGHQWKQQDLGFDPDTYVRGIKDAMGGGATLLTPEQAQQAIDAFKKEFTAKQQQKRLELAAKNKAEGEAFLATNKISPGIKLLSVNLPNGKTSELQYLVLTNGAGATPGASDTVTVNYRGTLLDGTEFDSSYKRGQPASFPIGGVIRGWTEALKNMTVGSKWKLFIPADLAYGEAGNRGIPPNSVLIFEVELLSTAAPAPQPTAAPAAPLTSDIIKVPSAEELKKGAKIEVIKPEDVQKAQAQQK